MKVKTNHVPEDCDYLTNSKEYEVIEYEVVGDGHKFATIKDDDGDVDFIVINVCPHLNGRDWEIIGEEDD
jgi:hypothetical protein